MPVQTDQLSVDMQILPVPNTRVMKTSSDQNIGVICALNVVHWRVRLHVFIVFCVLQ